MQALQVRGRVDAEFLGEPVPQRRVRGERLRLAAAPVQGQDPLAGEPFPQRVGAGHAVQFGDQAGVPAAGQVGVDPALQRGQPGFLEAAGVGLSEGQIGHVRQGRAPPQASAARSIPAAACAWPAARSASAERTRLSKRTASSSSPVTLSRYPGAWVTRTSARAPRARRSREI